MGELEVASSEILTLWSRDSIKAFEFNENLNACDRQSIDVFL